MNILWSIHLYPPAHNCGSEYVAHHINKFLISRGHECRVILHQAEMHKVSTPYLWEGVYVMGPKEGQRVDTYNWADVVLTHLDFTQFSIVMAQSAKRPIVHFVHNDIEYSCIASGYRGSYVVYNSEWTKKQQIGYELPSIVLPPPCDYDYYNVCEKPFENEFITLISLNQNKGGYIFYRLAEAMPERKFLGVIGSYDEQIIRHDLPNVTIIANTPNILDVYRKTKVLLMPSAYESWGRTATEAMCNGIPVIACPTPGLKENCAGAGIYVPKRNIEVKEDRTIYFDDEYNIEPIVKQIRKLDDKKYYSVMSELCRKRAKELDPLPQLNELEQFLINAKF